MRISARRAARFVRAVFPPSLLSAPWAPAGYPRRPILPGPAATTSPRGRRVPPSHHVGEGAAPARAAPRRPPPAAGFGSCLPRIQPAVWLL